MADAASKADFRRFWQLARSEGLEMELDMAWVPQAVKRWIDNPVEDDFLGRKILLELALYMPILGYN